MRVALLFEYATLNGGEHSMLSVLEQLTQQDFEFLALAPAHGRLAEALQERSIRHQPLELRDGTNTRLPREVIGERLQTIVTESHVDLLHANSLSMGRLTGAVADQLPVPTTAHLRDIIKLSNAAIRDLNRNRQLFAVSAATREFHIAQGLGAERVTVLYNGVDLQRFQPRARTGALHRELGIEPDAFCVLNIGQMGLRKGQDVLAEAATQLVARFPQVHYLLVGERHSQKAESIAFEASVMQRFTEAGLSSNLHRLGYRSDIPHLMNEANLLVHTAHQEPLGRVLLEAAASGLPILATDVGGTSEIVTDNHSARLIPPGDANSLAIALQEMIANSQQCETFAQAARLQMEQRFPIETAAENLARLWKGTVN